MKHSVVPYDKMKSISELPVLQITDQVGFLLTF